MQKEPKIALGTWTPSPLFSLHLLSKLQRLLRAKRNLNILKFLRFSKKITQDRAASLFRAEYARVENGHGLLMERSSTKTDLQFRVFFQNGIRHIPKMTAVIAPVWPWRPTDIGWPIRVLIAVWSSVRGKWREILSICSWNRKYRPEGILFRCVLASL